MSSFWGFHYSWLRGELPSQYPKLGRYGTHMPNILLENLVVQRSVPIYGITHLGLRSHPTGSSTLEALTTLSFIRSDKPVFNTPAFRPCSPCYPTQAVAEPIVSHIRNPYLTFPGRVHHFHRCLDPGLGCPHGGFSDCRYGPVPNASSTSMYWSSGQ